MTVPRSPLSSPVKLSRPSSLVFPEQVEELLKKPVEDVEAGEISPPQKEGFRCVWRTFAMIFGLLLASLILINGFVILLGLIDLL